MIDNNVGYKPEKKRKKSENDWGLSLGSARLLVASAERLGITVGTVMLCSTSSTISNEPRKTTASDSMSVL